MTSVKKEAPFFIFFLVFLGLRIWYLLLGGVAVDADEAIVGLMGRHILDGQQVIFFYGQEYMGSLEAYVAALFFFLFGSSSWALKLVPLIFAASFYLLCVHLARTLYGRRVGILTAVLLVSSSPFFLVWSVKARGGYMETLFFGTVLLVLAHTLLLSADTDPAGRQENCRGGLRLVVNGLLLLTVFLLVLQALHGGLQLQVGPLSISSRGYVRPLAALGLFWWTGVFLCRDVSLRWSDLATPYWKAMALFGFTAGLAWWTNPLVYFYFLPVALVLGLRLRRTISTGAGQLYFVVTFVFLFFLGSFPHWLYGCFEGFTGSGVTDLADMKQWLPQGLDFFKVALPRLLGCWFDFSTHPLVAGCSVVVLSVYGCSFMFLAGRLATRLICGAGVRPQEAMETVFFLFLLFYPILFAVSSLGWFTSRPRYLLPLFSVLPIITAVFLKWVLDRSRPVFSFLIMPFVLLSLLQIATLDILSFQPWVQNVRLPVHLNPLIQRLKEKNIRFVYADYWIAYRLVFESREEIICSVYPPEINDRYPLYTEMVGRAGSPAYIVMETVASGFKDLLEEMKIHKYKEESLAPFVLFYDPDPEPAAKDATPVRQETDLSAEGVRPRSEAASPGDDSER